MDKRILECLDNKQNSYILPFLWLHGEPKERLKEEILAIKNSGICEFCAESRPYEDFCAKRWWDDFKFILDTARELNMRVWLLDDKKFPTGYANGYLEKPENAHLRKRLIREIQCEALGPMKNAKIDIGYRTNPREEIINVVAYKYTGNGEALDPTTATNLTHTLNDGLVYWDIPKGSWRVCATIKAFPPFPENDRFSYYIDMLSAQSCHAMIDAIYGPHYEHFSEYFGNTFAGFFSDEPGFLNLLDTYHNTLGVMFSPYPWRNDLPELIGKSAGISADTVRLYLSALWEDIGEMTPLIRTHYMEVVTKLYSENFCYQLGNWCRDHGVMYIGHVIEDMNAHMRLAYGSGHFFRALDGQDMAGIDTVLMQNIPGVLNNLHRSPLADGGIADPAFFQYTLPKLAASHSHIQPLKKGRAMCEIFGAFGWNEGLPFMKGLADIMLASGINHFVPHAFSPQSEDKDCPPHFYNGGKNIQYPLFKNLMGYMGRVAHALSGGTHMADVCVFYNAEGEWTGGKNQPFHKICKILTQGQVDFDIVPFDPLENAQVENGKLLINGESYRALIISESQLMPKSRLACFAKLAKMGLPVIFTDSLPLSSAEGTDITELNSCFEAISSMCLVDTLRARGMCQLKFEGTNAHALRFFCTRRENCHIYLFSNEAVNEDIKGYVTLPHTGECLIYEPWENKCYKSCAKNGALPLSLEKGNMLFVIFGCEIPHGIKELSYELERVNLPLRFDISVLNEGEKEYKALATSSECFDITAKDCLPQFCGSVRYKTAFTAIDGFTVLDLGQVGETAEVWLNGKYLGARINAPYKFSLSKALKDGENSLEIIVQSNLGHKRRDYLNTFFQTPPTGIMGDISLCKYKS